MKKPWILLVCFAVVVLTSCSVGRGCPSNGKNVGAERLLSGDKQALKDAKRAGKFKS